MTLDAVFIEQGEELDTDEAFTFLRDRMRGKAHPRGLQQINVIANSNGRNWIWRRWIHEPESDDFYIVIEGVSHYITTAALTGLTSATAVAAAINGIIVANGAIIVVIINVVLVFFTKV